MAIDMLFEHYIMVQIPVNWLSQTTLSNVALMVSVVGSNLGSGWELSMTEVRPLSKAPNPQLLPGRRSVGCPLLQVCVNLDGLNAENTFHSSLYSV